MSRKRGFVQILVIIVIALVLIGGVQTWRNKKNPSQTENVQSQDSQQLDGSGTSGNTTTHAQSGGGAQNQGSGTAASGTTGTQDTGDVDNAATGSIGVPRPDPKNKELTLVVGGRERYAIVHLPPSYKKDVPTPVVLVFHGGGGFPDAVRMQSEMDGVADKHGFIAVYPAGSGIIRTATLSFNSGICCGYAMTNKIDDVRFTSELLDLLEKTYSIDANRVYPTGLSNGAMMSYRLACELSDRIAAIAPISTTMGTSDCKPTRPVSVMHFHGLKDQNALYDGGRGPKSIAGYDAQPVSEAIDFWVKANGCPQSSTEMKKGAAIRTLYGPCKENTEVALWTLTDGGHTWPGGKISRAEDLYGLGKVNQDISASELMWAFFKAHPLSR